LQSLFSTTLGGGKRRTPNLERLERRTHGITLRPLRNAGEEDEESLPA
jgi:hypothetical protein